MGFQSDLVFWDVIFSGLGTFVSDSWRRLFKKKGDNDVEFPLQLGINLVRQFLDDSRKFPVGAVQTFCSRSLVNKSKYKFSPVTISKECIDNAAERLRLFLGPEALREFGGPNWWLYRKQKLISWSMKHRKQHKKYRNNKVLFYVHGGAHFLSTVKVNAYHIQQHMDTLGIQAFAPEIRLAPQFPAPCSVHDALSSYLYLLTYTKPEDIVVMGDSSGASVALTMLCLLRDQNLPLPAGAVLESPWVDLTHSFPSITSEATKDYIPPCGFHSRASKLWPVTNLSNPSLLAETLPKSAKSLNDMSDKELYHHYKLKLTECIDQCHEILDVVKKLDDSNTRLPIDGNNVLTDILRRLPFQVQYYAPNHMLKHPLVSPVFMPNLGGLCPVMVTSGGAEIIRDEICYLAHKMANDKYDGRHTKVVYEVFDDCCHVVTALPFSTATKTSLSRTANFNAWCLRQTDPSFESSNRRLTGQLPSNLPGMLRLRVTQDNVAREMEPPEDMAGVSMPTNLIGTVQSKALRRWLEAEIPLLEANKKRIAQTHTRIAFARVHGRLHLPSEFENDCPPLSAIFANAVIH
ncbi:esterase/lipase [Schizosaccharomyces japonicus yFS275]|uniref:Esterase/lipase n=1 Tax=Schizosaccharomyces japonicus (strain yFS275 / FY16936) TaxID=402676 RepID=B6K2G1_SCHJY|nr:esterase/lipase [Schizosaccharomyces japonicus yFS275]EEB07342.1 esterase/lipase [Schizosaccharomyces japonicus yFS275]